MCLIVGHTKGQKNVLYQPKKVWGNVFGLHFDLEEVVKVSRKDKVVYKMLKRPYLIAENDTIHYRTPYIETFIHPDGEILVADEFTYRVASSTSPSSMIIKHSVEINQGIHSYSSKDDLNFFKADSRVLVECMIPAGVPYIEGIRGHLASLILVIPPIDKRSIIKLNKK